MADLIEKLVGQWLPEADVAFLTEKCTELNLAIPGDKADNQAYLVKLINRHLNSEALEQTNDGGKAVWLKLFGDLGALLGKGAPKVEAPEVPPAAPGAPPAAPAPADAGALTFHKLREFKISGTVNGGKEGSLQYVSLYSQIKLGQAAKYTTPEIIYGVIRAIPAASSFRTLLETNLDMPMPEFIKLLRSHFKEQDSDTALMELKGCYQAPDQGAHDFCCRAIFLRDRLEAIAAEEGSPWTPEKLRKRLYRTIATGLKQNSIKLELQPYLSEDSALSDREFLDKVAQAEVHEEERLGKVKNKEADIAALTLKKAGSGTSSGSGKGASAAAKSIKSAAEPPEWSTEIREYMKSVNVLTTKIDQLHEHASEQADRVKTLEGILKNAGLDGGSSAQGKTPLSGRNSGNAGPQSGNKNKVIFKCPNCVANKFPYCTHCFKCCEDGHKTKDCPN